MIRAQMLSELEEIVQYKQSSDQPQRQEMIRQTWINRSVFFQMNKRPGLNLNLV